MSVIRALAASALLFGANAWASEPQVAILLETSSGTPALSAAITSRLEGRGIRVVPDPDTRAKRDSLGLAIPVDDCDAERLRRELAADRLVVISARETTHGPEALRVRFVEAAGIARRYAVVDASTFDAAVLQLVEETPAVVSRAGIGPATSPTPVTTPRPVAPPDPSDPPRAEFGRAGTVEAGAVFGYYGSASKSDVEGFAQTRSQIQEAVVSPFIGIFPLSHVETTGLLSYRSAFEAATGLGKESYFELQIGGGVAVLASIGSGLHIGPQVTGSVLVAQRSFRFREIGVLRLSGTGRQTTAGLVAKVPLGRSALLTIDGHYFKEELRVKYHATQASGQIPGTYEHTGSVILVGFSWWHGAD